MNKLFSIILVALLSLPVCVWAVDENVVVDEPTPIANTLDEDVDTAVETSDNVQYKQPISKRKIAKKFLAAMGGVAASSFAIFFLLTVYNRARDGYINQVRTPEGEVSLESPDDLNGAVRTFIEKTKWG